MDYKKNGHHDICKCSHYQCSRARCADLGDSDGIVDIIRHLIETHGLELVLEALVKVLRKMKNPEHLFFQVYIVCRRAWKTIVSEEALIEANKLIAQDDA